MNEESFDVVVVGGGGSGLAAALGAAENGARVCVLEKADQLGGTSGMAIGSFTAGPTSFQAKAGVVDSVDQYFADLDIYEHPEGAVDNLELRKLLCENAGATLDWLISLGLVFTGPQPVAPHTRPRMHNVLPGARAIIHRLALHCRKRGAVLLTGQRVDGLIREGGRVTGVQVGERRIMAKRAVILASGDFSAAGEARTTYLPATAAGMEAINPDNTGDGHLLAQKLGASVLNGHVFNGPEIRFPPPAQTSLLDRLPPGPFMGGLVKLALGHLPRWLLRPLMAMYLTAAMAPSPVLFEEGAILINKKGERFIDERDDPAPAIPAQPGNSAFILFDGRLAEVFSAWPKFISTAPGIAYAYLADYARYRPDIYHQASSLEALATSMGVPAQALQKTVEEYNAGLSAGRAIATPPFYALGPAKSWIMTTDGGLAVSPMLEVLDGDDQPIPGLFAAGIVGLGGLMISGHGQHLGWTFTSGRLAGQAAAKAEAFTK